MPKIALLVASGRISVTWIAPLFSLGGVPPPTCTRGGCPTLPTCPSFKPCLVPLWGGQAAEELTQISQTLSWTSGEVVKQCLEEGATGFISSPHPGREGHHPPNPVRTPLAPARGRGGILPKNSGYVQNYQRFVPKPISGRPAQEQHYFFKVP